MTPIYMFSIPFFYFTLAAAKAADILPVFHILLDKLGPCDIQIIADGWRTNIDWHNVIQPVKIVHSPHNRTLDHGLIQINIFKSKVASLPFSCTNNISLMFLMAEILIYWHGLI